MRTGPAASAFAQIVAVTAINGQRNEHRHAPPQQRQHQPPVPSVGRQTAALHDGATVAPGQLLLAQLVGQTLPALNHTHRQGVAAYPSLSSAYQVISGASSLSRLHTPAPGTRAGTSTGASTGTSLFDFEI